jgi:hypothetical protein
MAQTIMIGPSHAFTHVRSLTLGVSHRRASLPAFSLSFDFACNFEDDSWFTTRWLADPRVPTHFLTLNYHWSSTLKSSICWGICYIDLLGSYLQHVINMFNTCSWVPIHQSLTNTNGGYKLGGLSTYHRHLVFWPPGIYRLLSLCLAFANGRYLLIR